MREPKRGRQEGRKIAMFFQERQQIAICVAATVMIGGTVLFGYLPLQKRIKVIKSKKASQMLAMTKTSAESRRLPALKEELLHLQRAVETYEQQVPSHRSLGIFLQEIAGLMNKHNLQEQLVQPGKEIKAGKLNCIPVNMQCKGKLAQIFEFYKSLQKLDRLARIEEIKLVNDRDFTGEVSMQTKAIIYYRSATKQG
ncbi:MAG: type 4a pilus biogenesis protein PilO [Planctomycetota bacterium]|nr:MAG: type 4a pilus biogenesis protein PilO [Planctomycetota bacterium]